MLKNIGRKRGAELESYLYILPSQCGHKVGVTTDPDKRLAQYNTLNPSVKFSYCKVSDGFAEQREGILLKLFENFRVVHQSEKKNESEVIKDVIPLSSIMLAMEWVRQLPNPQEVFEAHKHLSSILLWTKLHHEMHETCLKYRIRCNNFENTYTQVHETNSQLQHEYENLKRKADLHQAQYDDAMKQLKKYKTIANHITRLAGQIIQEPQPSVVATHEIVQEEMKVETSTNNDETESEHEPDSQDDQHDEKRPAFYKSRTHTFDVIKLHNKTCDQANKIKFPPSLTAWTDAQWVDAAQMLFDQVGQDEWDRLTNVRAESIKGRDQRRADRKKQALNQLQTSLNAATNPPNNE